MIAPIKRFIATPQGSETTHFHILFENFGAAVYYAQLFEGTLRLFVSGMQMAGLMEADPSKLPRDPKGIIDLCIGPMIKLLESKSRVEIPKDFYTRLKEANEMRNYLIHTFLIEHADEFISEPGQIAVTDTLFPLYATIRKTHAMLVPLVDKALEILGVTPEDTQRRLNELMSYGNRFPDATPDA